MQFVLLVPPVRYRRIDDEMLFRRRADPKLGTNTLKRADPDRRVVIASTRAV